MSDTHYSDSLRLAVRGRVTGVRTLGTRRGRGRATRHPERRCPCGKKISAYNPGDTCWQHAETKYPKVRGVK